MSRKDPVPLFTTTSSSYSPSAWSIVCREFLIIIIMILLCNLSSVDTLPPAVPHSCCCGYLPNVYIVLSLSQSPISGKRPPAEFYSALHWLCVLFLPSSLVAVFAKVSMQMKIKHHEPRPQQSSVKHHQVK